MISSEYSCFAEAQNLLSRLRRTLDILKQHLNYLFSLKLFHFPVNFLMNGLTCRHLNVSTVATASAQHLFSVEVVRLVEVKRCG